MGRRVDWACRWGIVSGMVFQMGCRNMRRLLRFSRWVGRWVSRGNGSIQRRIASRGIAGPTGYHMPVTCVDSNLQE